MSGTPPITNHAYARAAQRLAMSAEKLDAQAKRAWHEGKRVSVEHRFSGLRWVFSPDGVLITVMKPHD